MKKALLVLLSGVFMFNMIGCGSASTETTVSQPTTTNETTMEISTEIVGGWNIATLDISEEARAAFATATKNLNGESYSLEALLGTQVVAGTNYLMLCKKTEEGADGQSKYVIMQIYADLNGGAEITAQYDCE